MGIKETINKITKKDNNEKKEYILLDDKVNNFISWYQLNMVKDQFTDIGEYFEPRRMRDTIEKMAVWFELRYSGEDINKLINTNRSVKMSSNDVMFKYNQYVIDLVGKDSDITCFDWNEFYNYNAFFRSLSWEEKWFLLDGRYPDIIYLRKKDRHCSAHFHLDSKGTVIMADDLDTIRDKNYDVLNGEEFVGKNIADVSDLLKNYGCNLDYKEIDDAIKNFNNKEFAKEEFLNCVMYRIIERGGNRIGPRRGLLFAKEFKRDIDIPMKYGIDLTDPDLRYFINEYFKAGGKKELDCYLGYFYRSDDSSKFDIINLKDILKKTKYTEEEHILHQRLADSLNKAPLNKVKKIKESILNERVFISSSYESTKKVKKLVK